MNIWESAIITNKGLALQAKLHSGNTLSLTRAVVGAGTVIASDLIHQTSVTDERHEMSFSTQSYPEEGKCAVPLKLYNTNVAEGFTARQIGVYAFDPDEGEILYLIAQAIDGEGTAVPSASEMPGYLAVWTFYIQYGQADGVDVVVDPAGSMTAEDVEAIVEDHNESTNPHAGVLAKHEDLDAHTTNMKNPHGVTAEQLGLGNVDNTPDTEKHVAYAQRAGSADKAKYGLTIRFNGGRTENTDQWTYDGSTSRTVNITPDKIGAADVEHTHSASDVNSGTLGTDRLPTVPVTKGGTGATTAAAARTNLGAAAAKHSHTKAEITDFSHTHSASDVSSGTLSSDRLPTVPVTKGGTGATDKRTALNNLMSVDLTTTTGHIPLGCGRYNPGLYLFYTGGKYAIDVARDRSGTSGGSSLGSRNRLSDPCLCFIQMDSAEEGKGILFDIMTGRKFTVISAEDDMEKAIIKEYLFVTSVNNTTPDDTGNVSI